MPHFWLTMLKSHLWSYHDQPLSLCEKCHINEKMLASPRVKYSPWENLPVHLLKWGPSMLKKAGCLESEAEQGVWCLHPCHSGILWWQGQCWRSSLCFWCCLIYHCIVIIKCMNVSGAAQFIQMPLLLIKCHIFWATDYIPLDVVQYSMVFNWSVIRNTLILSAVLPI